MPAASTIAATARSITLTTDDGVVGVGDAAGPLGVIREYIKLLAAVLRRPQPL